MPAVYDNRALRLGAGADITGVLLPVNLEVTGRLDAQANLMQIELHDRDLNSVADDYDFAAPAGQEQHGQFSFLISEG